MQIDGNIKQIFSTDAPNPEFSMELKALWHDFKGNWDHAHEIVQNLSGKNAAWIHAYLHRKEGDIWNAKYWYSKAGKSYTEVDYSREFEIISKQLLAENQKK